MNTETKEVLKEYGRGIIGGLIFSLPLLYTMEMWWRGFTAGPIYLLSFTAATYLLLLGYNTYAGMKRDTSFKGVMWDSVEELGLAVITSFLFLGIIGKISLGMSLNEVLGKVIVESMMVAIGISVGTSQLGQSKKKEGGDNGGMKSESKKKQNELVKSLVLTICGAVLISSTVAPTAEILKIAVEITSFHLILMILLSLSIMAAVLYFVSFRGSVTEKKSPFEMALHVIIEYLVALIICFGLLYFFGRVTGYSFQVVLAEMIVLGVPAALGASAGKLLIGNN